MSLSNVIMRILATVQVLSEIEDEELEMRAAADNAADSSNDDNLSANEAVDVCLFTGKAACSPVLTSLAQKPPEYN